VLAFRPDSLLPWGWTSSSDVPALERAIGYDLDERIVWAVDEDARLVGIDLASGGWRAYLGGVRRAAVGPDGSVLVVDSANRLVRLQRRIPAVLPAGFEKPPLALWGAISGQALAVSSDSAPGLKLIAADHAGPAAPVGSGAVAPSFWGELAAVAADDELRLVRTSDASVLRTIKLPGAPSQVLFSPSGHRVLALVNQEIVVADRFSGRRLPSISLPGRALQARIDPSGRWLLVRPPEGDSAWVVDLATSRHVSTFDTKWREDLPLVAGAATLVIHSGDQVEAYDLSTAPPARLTTVAGGSSDLWIVIPWVPATRAPTALAAAQTAVTRQDRALVADSSRLEPAEEIWLQVSSSQNPEWAEDLAKQMRDSGHAAAVWRPDLPEDSYRVVVGPFGSREEGEEAGRRLGRPFFVVQRERPKP
jgi:hypothetical protein